MPVSRRSRLTALFASVAVVAATVLPSFSAAADEPPAPEPPTSVETPAPDETPSAEETAAPDPQPSDEPTPEAIPSESPAAEPAPSAPSEQPEAGVEYAGIVNRISSEDDTSDEGIALLHVGTLGFLAVDTTGWADSSLAGSVVLTLAVPAGVKLTGNAASDFTKLADAGASTPLTILAARAARSLAKETASLVNQTPNVAATHRIYAVLVSPNNVNTASSQRPTAAHVAISVAHADDYWSQQSEDSIQFALAGTVPWYKSKYSCKTNAGSTALWNQAAALAKTKLGYVASKNNHLVLFFPSNTNCGTGIGLGTIGWSANEGGWSWVIGDGAGLGNAGLGAREKATLAHELGHNLSLGHADWADCTSSAPNPGFSGTSGCTIKHYGDATDVMGFGSTGTDGGALSSAQAIRAGIWPGSAWQTAPQGTNSYTINDVALNSGLRGIVVQDDNGVNYFIEYRNFADEDAQYNGYGCDAEACVASTGGVRVLRLENAAVFGGAGWLGFPGDDSYLIGRNVSGTDRVNYTNGEIWWSKGATGIKVTVTGTTSTTATIQVVKPTDNSSVNSSRFWILPTSTSGGNGMRVGDTWTAVVGDAWEAQNTTIDWFRGSTSTSVSTLIATGQSYTLTAADLGQYIGARLTGSNPGGGTTVLYDEDLGLNEGYGPIGKGTYLVDDPGTVSINNTTTPFQAVTAGWPAGTTFTYQWYRGKTATTATTLATGSGAKTQSYEPNSADVNQFLRVKVTATIPGYSNTPARYSTAKNYSIMGAGTVTLTGSHTVGQLVTAGVGGVTYSTVDGPLSCSTVTFQWFRNGVLNPAETSWNYTILPADYNKKLTVKVVCAKPGWVTYVSPASTALIPNIKGTINGTHAVPTMVVSPSPFKLTATLPGGSIAELGIAYTYQWYRVDRTTSAETAIKGATKVDYTPTAADYPYELKVRVTVTKLNYNTVVLYSLPVAFTVDRVTAPKLGGTASTSGNLLVTPGSYLNGKTGDPLAQSETYQWYRDGKAITGATGIAYSPGTADKGKKITVTVTQASTGLLSSVVTLGTQPLAANYFGGWDQQAVVTQTPDSLVLTASPGVASVPGAKSTYQWYRGGSKISKATKATYKLTSADYGKVVWVRVVTSKSGYTTAVADSPQVDYSIRPDFAGTPPYMSSGNWQVGDQAGVYGLNFVTKDGSIASPTITYQWLRNGKPISGVAGQYYSLATADYGKKVTVRLTVSVPGYLTLVYVVPQTYTVAKGVTTVDPVVTVVPGAGLGTLTGQFTGLVPSAPTPSYAYKWYRGTTQVGTSSTYKLQAADAGQLISLKVTMTRANFTVPTTVLPQTSGVDYAIRSHGDAPTISGSPLRVGETLTATPPAFYEADNTTTLAGSPTYLYTWYRDGTAIKGATGEDYVLTASDRNKRISVKVSANLPGRLAASSAVSGETGLVEWGEFGGTFADPTVVVTTSRVAKATVTAGSVVPGTGNSLTYQWYRNGAKISKATKSSYTLTSADTGKDVTVTIKVTRAGYNPQTLTAHANGITQGEPAVIVGEPSSVAAGTELDGVPPFYYLAWGAQVPNSSVAKQWLRDGVPIENATDFAYDTTGEAPGTVISFRVTVTSPYHATLVETTPGVTIT